MVTTISQERLDSLNCVLGLDCSKYQKSIDWTKMNNDRVQFAFVKITEGTTGREDNIYNVKNRVISAQKNNIKIGYYHFARPGNVNEPEDDANEEASNVINRLNVLPTANLPLVLDIEAYSDSMIWDNKIDHMDRFINTFIGKLNDINISTIIYSYKSFLDLNIDSMFGGYPLWIAAYPNNPEINLPVLPNGWNEWKIWQFTEKGNISGYAGNIDLNMMKIDFFNMF